MASCILFIGFSIVGTSFALVNYIWNKFLWHRIGTVPAARLSTWFWKTVRQCLNLNVQLYPHLSFTASAKTNDGYDDEDIYPVRFSSVASGCELIVMLRLSRAGLLCRG